MNLAPVIQSKVNRLTTVINQPIVDIQQLASLAKLGIPDQVPALREISWKMFLGYLPLQTAKWKEKEAACSELYQQFRQRFLPEDRFANHPLDLRKDGPRWHQLHNDFLLWEQIEKDTSRTHASLGFFNQPGNAILVPFLTSARKQKFRTIVGEDPVLFKQFLDTKDKQRVCYRYDTMTRILFIYAKLNPTVQYVQGMNQILAPIFYAVNAHKPLSAQEEVSCFFMFNSAMSEVIDLHIKDMDRSQSGIYGKCAKIEDMLIVIDPYIHQQLKTLSITPLLYSFRWLALLFAQDFELFDVMRLWDSLWASSDRLIFMNFVALAILNSRRQEILENDFAGVLAYLTQLKDININQILKVAHNLDDQFCQEDFEGTGQEVSRSAKQIKLDQK